MAISQPTSGDKLNSPDHSLMHRQIATDPAAPAQSVDIDSNGNVILGVPVYEDVRIVPTSFDFVGNTDPSLVSYTPTGSGIATMMYEFAKNDVAYFQIQIPHQYKEGTDISVHCHWTPGVRGSEEGTNKVGWKVIYSWANTDGTFPAMATADLSDACTSTDDAYLMTPEVTIDGHTIAKTISSMLICQITRTDTGTDDTWASSTSGQLPLLLEVDFHFQIDTLGSRTALIK
jgi:hypothetical protein